MACYLINILVHYFKIRNFIPNSLLLIFKAHFRKKTKSLLVFIVLCSRFERIDFQFSLKFPQTLAISFP
jgi:hypothetical protein